MAELLTTNVIVSIFLSGILPTIIWLLFWLREDRFHPEPIGLLLLTFLAGVFGVFLVLPFEQLVKAMGAEGTEKILIFAAAEEVIKFSVVFFVASFITLG